MTEPAAASPVPSDAGTIALHLQGNPATTNLVPPKVTVNGYPVQTSYGTTSIPMPPGHHRIEVYSQWMRKFGQAAIELDLSTGQTVDVYYATPYHQFTTGSIGFEKQRRNGRGFLILAGSILAFLIVLIILLALI